MNAIHKSGKRKRAVARATLKKGNGTVKVNYINIQHYSPEMYRLKIQEPIILAGDAAKDLDIFVNVRGGGFASQAEASRLAIARTLVEHKPELKDVFQEYDRQLLVADVRRKECSKPNCRGHARSKKQLSKR
ncbi:MAG: 30S ribosomal protein S9 [Candidatus Woesearchaeota archaeon]